MVSVIGILVALVLPAVQAAREAGRRAQCTDHIRQVGIALNTFQAARRFYPPGASAAVLWSTVINGVTTAVPSPDANYAPQMQILPFVEETTVYNSVNLVLPDSGNGPANSTAKSTRVALYICPSESSPLLFGATGPTSYRANLGAGPYAWDPGPGSAVPFPGGGGGAFPLGYSIGPAAFTDGLSQTVMVSEKLMGDDRDDVFTVTRDYWCLGYPRAPYPPGDALIPLCAQLPPGVPPHVSLGGANWFYGDFDQTWYNHLVPPNSPLPGCKVNGDSPSPLLSGNFGGLFQASSAHPGGVNSLFGDGTVRFIRSTIGQNVWRAAATRAGGETIGTLD